MMHTMAMYTSAYHIRLWWEFVDTTFSVVVQAQRACITLSVAALCFAASYAYADTDVTAYGKINLTLNSIDLETKRPPQDEWQLNSNASRLGVKGSHDITRNLQLIYKMEFEVHIDNGKSHASQGKDTIGRRNIYAGLWGTLGTLIAGKHDTPLKLAQGKVDRFNDQVLGDIKSYIEGEDRLSNIVMYTSPAIKGVSVTAALVLGEDATGTTEPNGLIDGTSVSVHYTSKWFNGSIAHNNDIDAQDTTRLVADFKWENASIGFLWQKAKKAYGTAHEDAWLLSVAQKIGATWMLKAQYGQTDYSNNDEATQWVIGVDKKPSKRTKLFAYFARIKRADAIDASNDTSFAVGYEIKF